MTNELEELLTRELRDVAGGIQVPPMPSVRPDDRPQPRSARLWHPLLVAASVALVVGVVALVLSRQGSSPPQPAPSPTLPPSTSSTASPGPAPDAKIPSTAPTVPYVLDQHLYVDGAQVPGSWSSVESRGGIWLARQYDGSWWFGGPGADGTRIDAEIDQPPVLAPNGRYLAFVDLSGGRVRLTGFDPLSAGPGVDQAPIDLPAQEDGVAITVRAVTDDGAVIVQGTRTSRMWLAQSADMSVVDLTRTAPDQVFLEGTSAGLVVVDGADGATDATETQPYLATIATDGRLTRGATLPTYDDLVISPGGTWLLRSPAGTLAGEVTSVSTLRAQPARGGDEVVLSAPAGSGFANGTWSWEDAETLIAVLLPTGKAEQGSARLVRCNVALGACRGLDGPAPGQGDGGRATYSAEEALDAVVAAVVADDRPSLVDQDVVGDGEWSQLVGFAAGGGAGAVPQCRDNGLGTKDCEIPFEANPSKRYPNYAILEPSGNAYGWRITYVGVGGA